MPKITSIDALIDRIRVAYPNWAEQLVQVQIRDLMEKGYYAAVYDRLNVTNYTRYRTLPNSFSSDRILEIVDGGGNVIYDKFNELIEAARRDVNACELNCRLLPLREQLQDDFKASYEFNWVSEF